MQNSAGQDKITKNFFDYLRDLDISKKTHKNYRSDISHFTGWLIFKLKTLGSYAEELSEAIPFINEKTAWEYKNYLIQNDISENTINRRLSTLRHLARFLTATQIIDFDFMDGISNIQQQEDEEDIHPIVEEFEKHLKSEDVSKNTVKNYLSDVRQFISWLEKNHKTFQQNQ